MERPAAVGGGGRGGHLGDAVRGGWREPYALWGGWIAAGDGGGLERRRFRFGDGVRRGQFRRSSGSGADAHPCPALLLHHLLRSHGGSRPRHPRSGGEAGVGNGKQIPRRSRFRGCGRLGDLFQFGALRNQRRGLLQGGPLAGRRRRCGGRGAGHEGKPAHPPRRGTSANGGGLFLLLHRGETRFAPGAVLVLAPRHAACHAAHEAERRTGGGRRGRRVDAIVVGGRFGRGRRGSRRGG
mmetsp:Transcript_41133/g.87654  ORF Transcript_41133/g.87654 Transcript_41133/m.87654 type:complete len:239 (+) Transcript_41133:739-1455(+)